jgi:hypothetical protein
MAVRRDDHFDQPRRGPVFAEQATEDRPKVVAALDRLELAGGNEPDVVGFMDWDWLKGIALERGRLSLQLIGTRSGRRSRQHACNPRRPEPIIRSD